jgi:hypothetical protein
VGAFDSVLSDITSYRSTVTGDLRSALGEMSSSINSFYRIRFPKSSPSDIKFDFNKDAQNLVLPSGPAFDDISNLVNDLSQLKDAFQQRLTGITQPDISIELELTDLDKTTSLIKVNPLTKFKANTFAKPEMDGLANTLLSILNSQHTGKTETLPYIDVDYVTGVPELDNNYHTLTIKHINHFGLDKGRVDIKLNAEFDYKVRSAALKLAGDLTQTEMNFAANTARIYFQIAKVFLERTSKELQLWETDKELMLKYEWDKYTTTIEGMVDEFMLAVESKTKKAQLDMEKLLADFEIEIGKFEANVKATLAKVDSDKLVTEADVVAYQAELLSLETRYKTAIEESRVDYNSRMYNAALSLNSLVELLSSATPTAIALLTTKN